MAVSAEPSVRERDRLIDEYYPLVVRLARHLVSVHGTPTGIETDDLVAWGVIGLIQAWEKFDAAGDVPFEAYAVIRVRGAMIDAVRAWNWVPRAALDRAAASGDALRGLVSIDEHSAFHDGGPRSELITGADVGDPPYEEAARREDEDRVRAAVDRLPKRERDVVTRHYFDHMTLRDIAGALKLTDAAVAHLHQRGLHRLRGLLSANDTAA